MPAIDLPNRLSPIHDELASHHPTWGTVRGMPVAVRFADEATEAQLADRLAICDVSCLARMVVKGPDAATLLAQHGLAVPGEIFAFSSTAGALIVRTGGAEFFIEDGFGSSGFGSSIVEALQQACAAGRPGAYAVLRQDASFVITGSETGNLFSQVCSYDFRGLRAALAPSAPAGERLVMTQVAGVPCSILPGGASRSRFQLWADGTYGPYLWEVLERIAKELAGGPVGLARLFPDVLFDT